MEGIKEASLDLVRIRFVVLSFPLVQKRDFTDSKAGVFNVPRALSFVALEAARSAQGPHKLRLHREYVCYKVFSVNSPNGLLLNWSSVRRYCIHDLNVCYVG